VFRRAGTGLLLAPLALLASCGPDYSPNTYSVTAVQQANKVERGEVIGVRQIEISTAGVVGATTGAAAGGAVGGVAGSQTTGGSLGTALGAIGGSLVGGLVGTSVEHATGDTSAYEYIVRKNNGELVSVTQKDTVPLKIGTKVLVIAGNQARIVPDYTVDVDASKPETAHPAPQPPATQPPAPPAGAQPPAAPTPAAAPAPAPNTAPPPPAATGPSSAPASDQPATAAPPPNASSASQ
jgi:outer membrane lipoprotein SlyB